MKELPFAGMLRRVAVFAAAGALLVSCTKEYDGFPSAGNELRFSVSQQGEADAERAMTRATPVTENKFHDAFGVFGYSHLGEENWTDVAELYHQGHLFRAGQRAERDFPRLCALRG